ncbi:hypothetical protein [Methanosphaerula palustris]|uniref:hypothetical protein n=1 Tax=Methanosphaerula palustris TaxID=475088 RepID=UPI001F449A15|nr:hypothetical protein [Methanosphaerula palustris]
MVQNEETISAETLERSNRVAGGRQVDLGIPHLPEIDGSLYLQDLQILGNRIPVCPHDLSNLLDRETPGVQIEDGSDLIKFRLTLLFTPSHSLIPAPILRRGIEI